MRQVSNVPEMSTGNLVAAYQHTNRVWASAAAICAALHASRNPAIAQHKSAQASLPCALCRAAVDELSLVL